MKQMKGISKLPKTGLKNGCHAESNFDEYDLFMQEIMKTPGVKESYILECIKAGESKAAIKNKLIDFGVI